MRHHLLTRAVYDPNQWTDDELEARLDIFQAVTIPSVAAQTHKPDQWTIAVHPDDPHLYERLTAAALAEVDLHAIYVTHTGANRDEAAVAAYRAPWRQNLPYDDPALTSRLDDDDGLTADHFARVRTYVDALPHKPEAFVTVLPVGYRIYAGHYTTVTHDLNAMASLYTPAGDHRHVYGHAHRKADDHYPVIEVDDKPAWLWVRHNATLSGWKDADDPIDDEIRQHFPHIKWETITA